MKKFLLIAIALIALMSFASAKMAIGAAVPIQDDMLLIGGMSEVDAAVPVQFNGGGDSGMKTVVSSLPAGAGLYFADLWTGAVPVKEPGDIWGSKPTKEPTVIMISSKLTTEPMWVTWL